MYRRMKALDDDRTGEWPRFHVSRLWTALVILATVGTLLSAFIVDPRTLNWWIIDSQARRLVTLVLIALGIWAVPIFIDYVQVAWFRMTQYNALHESVERKRKNLRSQEGLRLTLTSVVLGTHEPVSLEVVRGFDGETLVVRSPSGLIRGPVRMAIRDQVIVLDMITMNVVGRLEIVRLVRQPDLYTARLLDVLDEETWET